MPDRTSPHSERELAWNTHVVVATRTPFVAILPGQDPDCRIAEAVYDSSAVHHALRKLAAGIAPDSRLVLTLLPAMVAAGNLMSLRSSWIHHCNTRFRLDAAAEDTNSEMSRQYVTPDTVRAWSHFTAGRAAYDETTAAVREFQPVLAQFCGVSAGTPGGPGRSGLRVVSRIREAS